MNCTTPFFSFAPLGRHLPLLIVAVALLSSGCGKTTPERPAPIPYNPNGGGQVPATPFPGTGSPAPAGNAAQVLGQVQQAWGAIRTLSANYDLLEKGKETETARVKFFYMKPSKYRYEVAQHTESIKNGSTSVFDTKTRKITSRLGGVASFIPIHGTLDDARSKSIRGWTLDQTDFATQTEMFLVPGAAVTLKDSPMGPVLELARPGRYPNADLARLVLDPKRMLPTTIELQERGQVVYRKRFTNLQVNPNISSDKFQM